MLLDRCDLEFMFLPSSMVGNALRGPQYIGSVKLEEGYQGEHIREIVRQGEHNLFESAPKETRL
jgi:hypothetical protein